MILLISKDIKKNILIYFSLGKEEKFLLFSLNEENIAFLLEKEEVNFPKNNYSWKD